MLAGAELYPLEGLELVRVLRVLLLVLVVGGEKRNELPLPVLGDMVEEGEGMRGRGRIELAATLLVVVVVVMFDIIIVVGSMEGDGGGAESKSTTRG